MKRTSFYVGIVFLILFALAANTWLGLANTQKVEGLIKREHTAFLVQKVVTRDISSQAHALEVQVKKACKARQAVAEVAEVTLKRQIKNSALFLSKVSFPGLTHQQLVQLTHQQQVQEKSSLHKLQGVAKEVCSG